MCYLGDVCSCSCTQSLRGDGLSCHEYAGLTVSSAVQLPNTHTHFKNIVISTYHSYPCLQAANQIQAKSANDYDSSKVKDRRGRSLSHWDCVMDRRRVPGAVTWAASYVMVLVSVWTMGTSFVVISVFWAAKVSEMVTISVFTTGGYGFEGRKVRVSLTNTHTHTR